MGWVGWALVLIGGVVAWKLALKAEGAAIQVPLDRFERCLHDDTNNSCATPEQRTSMLRRFLNDQPNVDDEVFEIALARAGEVVAQNSSKIRSMTSLDELVTFVDMMQTSGGIRGACYAAAKELADYQAKINATSVA